jgi:hypothetical protein
MESEKCHIRSRNLEQGIHPACEDDSMSCRTMTWRHSAYLQARNWITFRQAFIPPRTLQKALSAITIQRWSKRKVHVFWRIHPDKCLDRRFCRSRFSTCHWQIHTNQERADAMPGIFAAKPAKSGAFVHTLRGTRSSSWALHEKVNLAWGHCMMSWATWSRPAV